MRDLLTPMLECTVWSPLIPHTSLERGERKGEKQKDLRVEWLVFCTRYFTLLNASTHEELHFEGKRERETRTVWPVCGWHLMDSLSLSLSLSAFFFTSFSFSLKCLKSFNLSLFSPYVCILPLPWHRSHNGYSRYPLMDEPVTQSQMQLLPVNGESVAEMRERETEKNQVWESVRHERKWLRERKGGSKRRREGRVKFEKRHNLSGKSVWVVWFDCYCHWAM